MRWPCLSGLCFCFLPWQYAGERHKTECLAGWGRACFGVWKQPNFVKASGLFGPRASGFSPASPACLQQYLRPFFGRWEHLNEHSWFGSHVSNCLVWAEQNASHAVVFNTLLIESHWSRSWFALQSDAPIHMDFKFFFFFLRYTLSSFLRLESFISGERKWNVCITVSFGLCWIENLGLKLKLAELQKQAPQVSLKLLRNGVGSDSSGLHCTWIISSVRVILVNKCNWRTSQDKGFYFLFPLTHI